MSETKISGFTDNAAGGIAYVTCIPGILFLSLAPYNTRPYIRFHAWQSILMSIAAFCVWVAFAFFMVFSMSFSPFLVATVIRVFWMLWIVVWVLCAISALNGKMFKLPVIGSIAEKLANR